MPLELPVHDPILQSYRLHDQTMPGIWRYMFPQEFLNVALPKERQATCMNCPRIKSDHYRPDYRCCTYHPRVPNFSLGLALQTEAGRRAFFEAKARGMITPEGMAQSPVQYMDYLKDLKSEKFGLSTSVLCPLLDPQTGYCNIHAFRNTVCSTFFCINDHGKRGDGFWGDLQTLGSQIEISLSQWCLREIGFDLSRLISVWDEMSKDLCTVSNKATGGFSETALKSMWGDFYGREGELFERCAQMISDHRDVLWEIACDFRIKESRLYDDAMIRMLPKDLAEYCDDEDLGVDSEPVSCPELWTSVLRRYQKLRILPGYPLKISNRVTLDSHKDDSSCILVIMRRSSKSRKIESSRSVTNEEAQLIQVFQNPTAINWRLLASPQARAVGECRNFLAELLGQGILVRVKAD